MSVHDSLRLLSSSVKCVASGITSMCASVFSSFLSQFRTYYYLLHNTRTACSAYDPIAVLFVINHYEIGLFKYTEKNEYDKLHMASMVQ